MTKVATTPKQVWEFINSLLRLKGDKAEIIDGKCHVLNISEVQPCEWKFDNIKYRVYHSDGYCFDVEREYVDSCENEIINHLKIKSEDSFAYEIYPEVWDGFRNKEVLSTKKCLEILQEAFPNHE